MGTVALAPGEPDMVTGQGGQVLQYSAEAAVGGGPRGRAGVRLWPRRARTCGRGRRGCRVRGVLVSEGQRRPGLAEAPVQVAGEHADQYVGLDAFFQPVEDQAQVQVGLDVPEVPLDVLEVLVGADHAGGVLLGGGDGVRIT